MRPPETGSLPEVHAIAYPESYRANLDQDGASSFAGKVNHAGSRYYVPNDYYNMESDETLHILTHFETYQQTKEYTCSPSLSPILPNKTKRYKEGVA